MTPLFRKLNLKDHQQIVVLNSPPEFDAALEELSALTGVGVVRTVADIRSFTRDERNAISKE